MDNIKKSRFSLFIICAIMMIYISPVNVFAQINVNKTYSIVNTHPGEWEGASLSWSSKYPHPMISVQPNSSVEWQFQAVIGKPNTYKIINTKAGKWKGASISWDNKDPHPMISLEFNDPVEWLMTPVSGKTDTYKIVNTYDGKWKGASISWDNQRGNGVFSSGPRIPLPPKASLEFNDPVEWKLVATSGSSTQETASMVEYRVGIDNCHSDINNEGTSNRITVEFWSEGELINSDYKDGIAVNCSVADAVLSIKTSQEISHILVKTNGSDGFYIDEIRLYKGNVLKQHHGRDNGSGWCLSTDPKDANGSWEGKVAGDICKSVVRFDY